MSRYASDGARNCGINAINEFKQLVKEAHKRGIEVMTCVNMDLNCWFMFDESLIQISTGAHGCGFQSHC